MGRKSPLLCNNQTDHVSTGQQAAKGGDHAHSLLFPPSLTHRSYTSLHHTRHRTHSHSHTAHIHTLIPHTHSHIAHTHTRTSHTGTRTAHTHTPYSPHALSLGVTATWYSRVSCVIPAFLDTPVLSQLSASSPATDDGDYLISRPRSAISHPARRHKPTPSSRHLWEGKLVEPLPLRLHTHPSVSFRKSSGGRFNRTPDDMLCLFFKVTTLKIYRGSAAPRVRIVLGVHNPTKKEASWWRPHNQLQVSVECN